MAKLTAFVAVTDAARAKEFYGEVLGLRLVREDGFALVFQSGNTILRASLVKELRPQPFTVLGWEVSNAAVKARDLASAGARLERFAGLEQDDLGLWYAPGGAVIGWFKDPDGNVLSIQSFGG